MSHPELHVSPAPFCTRAMTRPCPGTGLSVPTERLQKDTASARCSRRRACRSADPEWRCGSRDSLTDALGAALDLTRASPARLSPDHRSGARRGRGTLAGEGWVAPPADSAHIG